MSQPPYSGPSYPDEPNQGQPYPGQHYRDTPPSYGREPYDEQPSSGQPSYGEPPAYGEQRPAYGEQRPAYGQPPAYGQAPAHGTAEQPAYGPPDYREQPPPDFAAAPPPPRRKSRALTIVLVSLGVALVLCIGAGTAVFFAGRDKAREILDAARQAASSAPGGGPTTEATRDTASTITLTEPKRLGGRPKLTDPQFSALADQLQSGMSDIPHATRTVGALYGTPAKENIVMIAGAAAPIDDPNRELDSAFAGAGVSGMKVSGITSVDPGPLGGVAKCGKADEKDVDMAMCSWADDGSVGWIMFFSTSVKSAKAEFPKLRAQIEKRSS